MHEATSAAGENLFEIATAILIITYAVVISERINRAVIALLGAGAMIIAGVITQDQAIAGIDFNTIALLAGMMMIVGVTKDSGVFQYVAIRAAKVTGASPGGTLALLGLVTALFSALLDNVTTVLLMVPVTIALTRELKVNPYPFLFAIILTSNIGGTSTLIGDPPNIIIGSAVGLSFNDFVFNLGPVVAVILLMQIIIGHIFWGAWLRAKPEDKAHVMERRAIEEIRDWPLLWKSMFVMALVIAGFILHSSLHLEAGTIALSGAALLIFLDNLSHHHSNHHERVTKVFHEIEWITLFFFIGLFIVIAGVEHVGLIGMMADWLLEATDGDYRLTGIYILWGSAVLSAIVDNIPFVATMIPLIENLESAVGGKDALMPYWWALSLGACLGGNGTLIGASANLTVAGIAEGMGVRFGFIKFTLYAFPMMLASIAVSHFYLLWRYF